MKKHYFLLLAFLSPLLVLSQLGIKMIHHDESGFFAQQAREDLSFDPINKRLYVVNRHLNRIDYYDYTNLYKPTTLGSIDLDPYLTEVLSVDALFGTVAVSGNGVDAQLPGKLLLFDEDGVFQTQLLTGSQPVKLSFTPGGNQIVVIGEGAPSDDYLSDPRGTLSILNMSAGVKNVTQSDMTEVDFSLLDSTSYDAMIRVFGNNGQQTPSQDLEPAGLAIAADNSQAYVSLQENNALAVIDLLNQQLDTVVGLGYKDFGSSGLDASAQANAIHIDSYTRLYGLFQPKGLAAFSSGGNRYLLSANQGAARHNSAYSEIDSVKNLPLDPSDFPQPWLLQNDTVLGHLQVTTTLGQVDSDILYDSLFTFGARSVSIWDDQGQLIWDSGDEIEQAVAAAYPAHFNSSSSSNTSYKSQSPLKGPEPSTVTTGVVDGTLYGFVGLAQMGGFMIYDLSNPMAPSFVQYELQRDFASPASNDEKNDLGPSQLEFIGSFQSPLQIPTLVVSHSVSGTISTYILGSTVSLPEAYPLPPASLYPNPSTGIFHSHYSGDFKVYNLQGQLVKEVRDSKDIDLSEMAAGYYLVKDAQGQALRVIKN